MRDNTQERPSREKNKKNVISKIRRNRVGYIISDSVVLSYAITRNFHGKEKVNKVEE